MVANPASVIVLFPEEEENVRTKKTLRWCPDQLERRREREEAWLALAPHETTYIAGPASSGGSAPNEARRRGPRRQWAQGRTLELEDIHQVE